MRQLDLDIAKRGTSLGVQCATLFPNGQKAGVGLFGKLGLMKPGKISGTDESSAIKLVNVGKRSAEVHELKHDHSKRPDVGRKGVALSGARVNLRRHPSDGSDNGFGRSGIFDNLGRVEIRERQMRDVTGLVMVDEQILKKDLLSTTKNNLYKERKIN